MESNSRLKCYDCIHLAPVDVFSGICHLSKKSIQVDAEACGDYEPLPKCKFCAQYRPLEGEPYLGTCGSSVVTYPDLVTKTCDSFQWREDLTLHPTGGKKCGD